ncbi:asparagine synthase-related protein [Kitasatospora sp. NPDC059599]|uniref:asparagine synthase-related protein n=1 Tax=Kitasatospora sp. NPDC059599 TaxID=3346880 RepID=UPI0036992BFF
MEISPGQAIRIKTGPECTAPQYLAAEDGVLHGSWDLMNLRDHQDHNRLDHLAVTRHLALRARYTAATFWQDIRLLTERSTAHFGQDGPLIIQFPEPAEHSRARSLQTGADPVPLFLDLLSRSVSRIPWKGSRTAVQLSGGMDSTVVALGLRTAPEGAGVTAGTVILDAERGVQQSERCSLILEHIASGWSSVTVRATDHLPYGPTSRYSRRTWISPYQDIYADALDTLSGRFTDHGVRAVFTGIGGDELMATTEAEDHGGWGGFERPDTPPWLGPAAKACTAGHRHRHHAGRDRPGDCSHGQDRVRPRVHATRHLARPPAHRPAPRQVLRVDTTGMAGEEAAPARSDREDRHAAAGRPPADR